MIRKKQVPEIGGLRAPGERGSPEWINSFNHFRAIAIIFIVAGHSLGITGMKSDTVLFGTIKNLLTGGTCLFVFISGFLFHFIYYRKFKYAIFLKNKTLSVFMPYLFLGVAPILVHILTKNQWPGGHFLPTGEGVFPEYVIPVLKYYASGAFLTAYWYVPFIMITFVLSPLHVQFIKLNPLLRISIVLFLFAVSLFMHRPVKNIFVIQSVIFFSPVYLLGITCSMYRQNIYDFCKGREFIFLAAAIGVAFYQAHLGNTGNYSKEPFAWGGIDLMLIQKVFLCVFLMVWLNKYERVNNKAIHMLASTSFAIYFLHPHILFVLHRMPFDLFAAGSWLVFTLFVAALILLCMGLAKATRKIVPRYSRYLIGY